MSESEKIIAVSVFKSLVHQSSQAKNKIASIAGELGERIKHHVEASNLHAGAFKIICMLDRKAEDKRDDFIRSLQLYIEMAENEIWADGHTGDIADMAAQRERDAEEFESAAGDANGKALAKGIKPLDDADAAVVPLKPKKGFANAPVKPH